MSIYPDRLRLGDEIRIIAPSGSLGIVSEQNILYAKEKLESMGYCISFGENVKKMDISSSSPIESRIEDLHEAFSDRDVKGIFTAIGGFNSNQLLTYLDYDLIRRNPKVLCGFSDITALQNAIYARTGLVSYSGPHFSTFGMLKGLDYTVQCFQRCCMEKSVFAIAQASDWSNDAWYLDQESRSFFSNEGWHTIQEGEAEGTVIGGNLGTLTLLQGTRFMPSLVDCILFLEDDELTTPDIFDRDLQSLLQQTDLNNLRGIAIGRFQSESMMTKGRLEFIIHSKKELRGIPVIANLDFGHTTPIFTFPIGGKARICVEEEGSSLTIMKH